MIDEFWCAFESRVYFENVVKLVTSDFKGYKLDEKKIKKYRVEPTGEISWMHFGKPYYMLKEDGHEKLYNYDDKLLHTRKHTKKIYKGKNCIPVLQYVSNINMEKIFGKYCDSDKILIDYCGCLLSLRVRDCKYDIIDEHVFYIINYISVKEVIDLIDKCHIEIWKNKEVFDNSSYIHSYEIIVYSIHDKMWLKHGILHYIVKEDDVLSYYIDHEYIRELPKYTTILEDYINLDNN